MRPRKKPRMAAENSIDPAGPDHNENSMLKKQTREAKAKSKTKIISLKETAEKFAKEVQ